MSQREILFKAKRTDSGEWVEGYLWSKRTIGYTPPVGNTDEIVIDPETVCQYTGLTDKNGVKIWEGDILEWKRKDIVAGGAYSLIAKYGYGERLVVRWLPAGFMLCQLEDRLPDIPNANGKIDNYDFWNCHAFWEVVGNIHDN